MRPIDVSLPADNDLFQIWSYLSDQAGAYAANRVEGDIYDAFEKLRGRANPGHRRPDLTAADVYFFAVHDYLIVYRRGATIEIARVLHVRRNIRKILRADRLR